MSQKPGRHPHRRLPAGHPDREPRPARDGAPLRVPQITHKPRQPQTPTPLSWRHPVRAVRAYLDILFDLKFSRYLTVQLLPLLYVVLVLGGLVVIGQLVWDAFAVSPRRGLAFLLASPLALLVWASACRATTEFLLVVFRMSEDVRTLASIKPTVDRLDGLLSGNNWLSRLMPFLKAYQASKDTPPQS